MARKSAVRRSAPAAEQEPASPLRLAVFLAPLVAGLAAAALINLAFRFGDGELASRFWGGIRKVNPASAPEPAVVNVLCVVGAILLWLLAAAAIRRGGPFSQALRLEAYAFLPFLAIILLVALDNYVYPGIVLFAVHAVTLAVAGFAGITAYLVVSAPRSQVSLERAPGRAGIAGAITAAGVYFAVFAAMNTLQYYSLAISYTDTADWEQMLYNTLHGRFLMSSAFPHMFFGEHVQFIHLLLLPLYALFPSLVTLMVVESLALASGAVAVYLVAARRLGSAGSALCFAGAYLLYPAMQYVDLELVYNTFRPETFAIPALLWAVYFLDRDRMLAFSVAALLALAAKEEMALPVAMLGILVALKGGKRWGAAFASLGLLWFVVSVFVVIPHFRQGASHMGRYYQDFWSIDAAGASLETPLSGVVVNILRNPLHAIAVMLQPVKVDYLLMLLAPLGLLPLLSWRMALVMLPSLATALLASRLPSFTIYNHYQIPLVPFLGMGAVYGAEQALRWSARRAGEGSGARQPAIRTGLAAYVLFAALAGNVLLAKSPLSLNFYNPSMQTYWRTLYVPDARSRVFFKEVRPLVPERASVSATEFAATYFARRERDFVFPDGLPEVDYVVIDTRDRWLATKLSEKQTTVEEALRRGPYEAIFDKEGFLVYRKVVVEPVRNP